MPLGEPSKLPRVSRPQAEPGKLTRGEFEMQKTVTSLTMETLLVPAPANR